MGGRRKCRLWWPNDLFSSLGGIRCTPLKSSFLFAWFFSTSDASFDVVVAFCCDETESVTSSNGHFDLEEILRRINEMMPPLLQEKGKFSLLGSYEADFSDSGKLVRYGNGNKNSANLTITQRLNACISNCARRNCGSGCPKHEELRLPGFENIWIKLLFDSSNSAAVGFPLIPKLDHLHLNNEIVSNLDLHVCDLIWSPLLLGYPEITLSSGISFQEGKVV